MKRLYATLFFLAVPMLVFAGTPGDVSLMEVLENTGGTLEWDPYRGHGSIVRGNRIVSFALGRETAIGNLGEIHRIQPPRREDGTIVFGGDFLSLVSRFFPPPETMRRVGAIFIDPGHGGRDPGAIGRHEIDGTLLELKEKDVVLDSARVLEQMLRRRYPDKEIVLARSDDTYLTLEERTDRANSIPVEPNESVLFVSIHANASLNSRARGFEVWVLPPEFRRRNLVSAERSGVEDPDVLSILNTIREEELTLESTLLARNVLSGLDATVGDRSPNRGIREESWYVVRNARMPSILIEIGFLTHREEFLLLKDDAYLREITQGIYTGLVNFVRNFEGVGRD